jgi:acetolactate synthase-1/2/3 large subunit
MKYSDYFMDVLKEHGYTTCFFVGGGNSMHLLESASSRFECIAVTHEVTAAIATEYFNYASKSKEKAFALVTAGPGLTNLITGIAGAWLDFRELLIVGGQAKSTNLSRGTVRQMGHQEINGTKLVATIVKKAFRIEKPILDQKIYEIISLSWESSPGPVFVEVCLDVSASDIEPHTKKPNKSINFRKRNLFKINSYINIIRLKKNLEKSKRPLILLGNSISKESARRIRDIARKHKIPIACTWTGADKCGFDYEYFAGRPNTYGMRWANIFQQQTDLLIAIGTNLGFQQTGFNTDEFITKGSIFHILADKEELRKRNPKKRYKINLNPNEFSEILCKIITKNQSRFDDWSDFLIEIKELIPTLEDCQKSTDNFSSPHEIINYVSKISGENDQIIACSSGGTMTATMQCFENHSEQTLLTNEGLASMGYGLAGAIGASIFNKECRTILFEGDGGFLQNAQEISTAKSNNLNLKIFLTCNDGYASIRTSQKNYFNEHYIGCDDKTGLKMPNWKVFFAAFEIEVFTIDSKNITSPEFLEKWNNTGTTVFLINADPNQMYLPKIYSVVDSSGQMKSTPLHLMSPSLDKATELQVIKFIKI